MTKALGVGVVTTAVKADAAPAAVLAAAVASMTASNAEAAATAVALGATGCTDVTGFGLLGHLMKMAAASGADAVLDVTAVPLLAAAGFLPGGSRRNRDWVAPTLDAGAFAEFDVLLLADAQTSAGLLFGVVPDRAAEAVAQLGGDRHGAGRHREDPAALRPVTHSRGLVAELADRFSESGLERLAIMQQERPTLPGRWLGHRRRSLPGRPPRRRR